MSGKRTKTKATPKAKVKPKVEAAPDSLSGTSEFLQKLLGKKIRIKCKNKTQKDFINLIAEKEIIIAAGPPGTGKSYLSIGKAIELLQNKTNKFDRLIIIKPAVEAEENLGFLPGTLREKLDAHVASSIDIVDKILGEFNREKMEESKILKIEGLGFLRGKTIDNSIVIIEEAQNISPNQMKTILTRIGENSKYIISGDLNQSDKFKRFTQTGLYDIFTRHEDIEEIGFFIFKQEDIVRNPLITKILDNYDEKEIFNDASLVVEEVKEGFIDLTKLDMDHYIMVNEIEFEPVKKESEEKAGETKEVNEEEIKEEYKTYNPKEYDELIKDYPFLEKIYLKIKFRVYYFASKVI
jgi:phosphate starvation-inducible protein PhoH